MSFRTKLGIAFCSILLLTITVAFSSWLGMDAALKRQNLIFTFTLDSGRLFNTISHEEHTFVMSRELSHASDVSKLLDEMRHLINTVKVSFPGSQLPLVDKVLSDTGRYQISFTDFAAQMVNMETMQSRMISESERLLSISKALTVKESAMSTLLLQQISRMLQAEKDYILSGADSSAREVTASVSEIEKLAKLGTMRSFESSQRLKAFRISKVAAVYNTIFSRFLDEQRKLREKTNILHHSRDELEKQLRDFVDNELEVTRTHVSKLKIITLAVSLAAVLLSIAITLVLSSRITRPIAHLKQSAMDILSGNLTTQVAIDSQDEIGQLGVIFNQMTNKLRDSFADVMQYRNHLEELVAARTLELEKEIGDRSAAEQALRASEEQLRTIIDQSPMGIILWDKEFRVVQWNHAAEKIFGYSAEEAIGCHASMFLPTAMHVHIDTIWTKLISSVEGVRSHNENIHKDGHHIQCDWFNNIISDNANKVLGALSLVENVTDRLRLEKELLKLEKLESTGILAGGIAHDFNNILTAILGNLNLSLLDNDLSRKTRTLLQAAEKASIRAKTLTQQLLTFAKGGEPIRESTDLADIIEDSAAFVLHGGNVSASYQISDHLWYADIDRGQISQVIQNVVLNARHAMPNGGKIRIVAENVTADSKSFGLLDDGCKYVKISISDNGIGIPPNIVDKIFDPYFSTKQEGSGLGLAISLSIINKHNGHVFVNSEPGLGTEFIIYLPALEELEDSGVTGAETVTSQHPVHILVMDDEEAVLYVLQSMLEFLGHTVTLCREGNEAIKKYTELIEAEMCPDLVITDLTIPGGLGGKETVTRLKEINPEVRAIVSSGYSTDPVMASFREYGFHAAVTKPFVLEDLVKAISSALSMGSKEDHS